MFVVLFLFSKKITLINILNMLSMTALTFENTSATPLAESTLELGLNNSLLKFLTSKTSQLASSIKNMRFTA